MALIGVNRQSRIGLIFIFVSDQLQSLQDALATRRPEFAHRSEQRLADAKTKAKQSSEKKIEELGRTIASWKKTRGLNAKSG